MAMRGWEAVDVILVSGDAYIDHPSFGIALVGRWLESHGFRVAILPQPRHDGPEDFTRFGRPRLFFGISAGNLDSVVANYSGNAKVRDRDDYSPHGNPYFDRQRDRSNRRRPDRATIRYSNLARAAYGDVPVVIGGLEASLRRFVHYDFQQARLRASVLTDSKADLLVYGMGEKAVLEIAGHIAAGRKPAGVAGTCERLTEKELFDELERRFDENHKALYDLRQTTIELETVNKKLQESEKLKGNFLSNIRNEMNDPLASILGLSKQLLSSVSTDREIVVSVIDMIHSEAFNLDFQLKNIFAAAEIEAGDAYPDVSNVDINGLISSIANSFRYKIDSKNLTLDFAFEDPDEDVFFRTDPAKLHLIISNLVSNAIEYSFKGGHIDLKACKYKEGLAVSVTDLGIGIGKADLEIIFDRFKQLETGTTKSHKGQGLGLSITKSYIELLSGTITVSSEKKKGSTFDLTIPEAEYSDQEEAFSEDSNEFVFEEKEF